MAIHHYAISERSLGYPLAIIRISLEKQGSLPELDSLLCSTQESSYWYWLSLSSN
jgi:hypothetical protein